MMQKFLILETSSNPKNGRSYSFGQIIDLWVGFLCMAFMLSYIEGTLVEVGLLHVIIGIGGLGYHINAPLTVIEKLPKVGNVTKLYLSEIIREDQHDLYGFLSKNDRDFFELMIARVSGIGPKIALNIMSRLSVNTLKSAIFSRDTELLKKCHGIGKKTAERIVIELGDKVDSAFPVTQTSGAIPSDAVQDAIHALISLGYKPTEADKHVRNGLAKIGESASSEELIKYALKS
ncbi:MAG: Holliday junction branch migration protein RuvA [Puniceicoccales bacterium]|nr:Holliday junction branch migration protein RuvA [Puniceicoccales bacterium]